MEKLITVIIPCYNAKKYIENTVNSVLEQTISEEKYQILIINDGSTDNTLEILEKIEKKYPNLISVVSQTNQGVAKTRNLGITLSESKYLTFLDADDLLAEDFLEKLLNTVELEDYDVVVCGANRQNASGEIIKKFGVDDVNSEWAKWMLMASWGKIYKTQFLKEYKITFLDSLFGEDAYFILNCIVKGANFKVLDYIGYSWMYNPESMTNTQYDGLNEYKSNQIISMLDSMIKLKTSKVNEDLFSYFILKQAVNRCLSPGRKARSSDFIKHYKRTIEYLEEKYPQALRNPLVFRGPDGEDKFVKMSIAIFILLHRLGLMPLFAKIYCQGKK